MFRRNVGGVDRVLRVTLGPILFLAGLVLLTGRAALGLTLVVVGLLGLGTGVVRFCVLYVPFGISTAKPKEPRTRQVCDSAAWMTEMRDECDPATPPRASQEPTVEKRYTVHR